MTEKPLYPVHFSIHDFSVDKFVMPSGVYSSHNKEIQAIKEFTFGLIKSQRIFVVIININLMRNSTKCLTIQTSTKFKFEKPDFYTYFNEATSQYIFPKDFVFHLATVALGTTRGYLFSKTDGLTFKNYLLPVSNLNEFIKSDVVL